MTSKFCGMAWLSFKCGIGKCIIEHDFSVVGHDTTFIQDKLCGRAQLPFADCGVVCGLQQLMKNLKLEESLQVANTPTREAPWRPYVIWIMCEAPWRISASYYLKTILYLSPLKHLHFAHVNLTSFCIV